MPDFRAYVRESLPPLGLPGAREEEIVEELAIEFEERFERALRNGLDPEQAWNEVLRNARPWHQLADELRSEVRERAPVEPKRESSRALTRFVDDIRQDFRYAFRQLRKSPAFLVTAVLTVALGIGANTAIFSIVNAVLLRTLPVREPQELVFFGTVRGEGSTGFLANGQAFSYRFLREFRDANQAFSDVAAINSLLLTTHGRVGGSVDLEKLDVELVSGNYFSTLGVDPALGRVLADSDDRTPGAHPIAVASHAWWQRRLAPASALGETVRIGSTIYSIVGVAAPGFSGVTVGQSPDLWIPLAMEREVAPGSNGLDDYRFLSLHLFGRLKPEIGVQRAEADANLLIRRILLEHAQASDPDPRELDAIRRLHIPLTPALTGRSRLRLEYSSPLKILMVVVALVLLIACANVANLLLARANARRREIAIRMSLGARRWRLIRQLLLESGILGFSGAVFGLVLAQGANRLLLMMVSRGSDVLPLRVTPNLTVLAFTTAVTIVTVFLFGITPALYATRVALAPSPNDGRTAASLASRNRLSRGLVVAQVAVSFVLLVGAGLFVRTLQNLMNVDTGWDRQNVLVMQFDPAAAGYQPDARLESMMERVEENVGAIPGVRAATFARDVFTGGGWSRSDITVPGKEKIEHRLRVDMNLVGHKYFDTMKLPILLGRPLNSTDNAASAKVAVINETFSRTYFPGESPIGRIFSVGDDPQLQNIEVVGVMKDAKYMYLDEEQMGAAFFPHAQYTGAILDSFVARYDGDPSTLVSEIRAAIRDVDPNLPVFDVTTLAGQVEESVQNKRLVAHLCAFFAGLAAFLACIGIYGVMSYGITRRTGEFGVRMALGAERHHVLWVVLREALGLAMIGVLVGLLFALAASRIVESLLFGVKPQDPLTIVIAIVTMTGIALVAGYLPARRATLIDPMVALRYD